MEIIQTKETVLRFQGGRRAVVYIEESKTNYYVSFRPITDDVPGGWACWIGPFKEKKSKMVCNMLAAAEFAYIDYMKDNIWGWK